MNQFNLKEFRFHMNLTQKQVIAKIGVPNVTITQIENGRKPMSREIKKKIFEAYGIDEKQYA
ncbi:MAG TPA: helix-turn-helix transcriptional regulator [Chitinophagaceae bacterium]|nr:helix-turn-helix transcriptional regulator [Chitinophagaceae bacterium]